MLAFLPHPFFPDPCSSMLGEWRQEWRASPECYRGVYWTPARNHFAGHQPPFWHRPHWALQPAVASPSGKPHASLYLTLTREILQSQPFLHTRMPYQAVLEKVPVVQWNWITSFHKHVPCRLVTAFVPHSHNCPSKTQQQVSGTETSCCFLAAGDHSPQVPQGWQKHPGDRQRGAVLPDELRVPHGAECKAAAPGHPGGAERHGVLPGSHSKSCPASFGSPSSPSYVRSLAWC